MLNTMAAIKTKRVPIRWDNKNKKTVFDYGDKDPWGKTVWFDEDGMPYEMIYARLTKQYSLNPLVKKGKDGMPYEPFTNPYADLMDSDK